MSYGAAAKHRVGWGAWARLALAILMAVLDFAISLPEIVFLHSGSGLARTVIAAHASAIVILIACIALGQRRSSSLEAVGWLGLLLLLFIS